jgi:methylmalonyl-CoA mutase cobalamin-binding subunit
MAADLFGKEGWEIDLLIGKDHSDLVSAISQSGSRIIGLSAAGAHATAALARAMVALRLSNPAAAIFLSGQIVQEAPEEVQLMGFDGILTDMPTAQATMDEFWQRFANSERAVRPD